MVFAQRAVLQFVIIIFTINGLNSVPRRKHIPLGVLSQLLSEDSKTPLIVLVDTGKRSSNRNLNDDIYRGYDYNDAGEMDYLDDALLRENYQSVLYNVLRSNQDAPDNEEDRIAQEILIENALRSRCQAIVQCEEKCSVESEEKPKKFCQKSCKAVFDHLLNCPPQGNQKKEKKKKDKCGPATGKTCPPSW